MWLKSLSIENLRNIQNISLNPSPRFNLITGKNASGKSSLMEAIYMCSIGKSFREQHFKEVISHGHDRMQVVAHIGDGNPDFVVGVERTHQATLIRLKGQTLEKMSQLNREVPIRLIHPESQDIVCGSPEYKRKFLDWGLFHVEHSFYSQWLNYKKALAQRNAALATQRSKAEIESLDSVLTDSGKIMTQLRQKYINELISLLNPYLDSFYPGQPFTLVFYPGWDENYILDELWRVKLLQDQKLGYTRYGPHRADLMIKCQNKGVGKILSRGQQKILAILLLLAQQQHFVNTLAMKGVILLDDLAAELDQDNRRKMLSLMDNLNVQIFISATDAHLIDINSINTDLKMFHMEHGKIKTML